MAIVVAVAAVASLRGLSNDFVYDDIPIIRDDIRVHGLTHWWTILHSAYWPPPFVEQLYRPLPLLMFAGEYSVGGGRPIAFRVVSYLLYAVCSVAVFQLTSRLLPRPAALATAVLFAAHPVHVEAVALGVNQNELLVTLFAIVMVYVYLQARVAARPLRQSWLLLALLYAAAMLSKEGGFVLPGLLLAAELIIISNEPFAKRARALWPGYALLAVVAVGVLAVRAAVLGGSPVSVVPAAALRGSSVGERMLTMLKVVPMWFRLFAWPSHLQADYLGIDASRTFGVPEACGAALILAAIVIVRLTWKRAPVVCFGLVWCVVALVPVSNVIPTGILLAERTLFLPSVGFLLAAGGALDYAWRRWPAAAVRRALVVACAGAVAFGIARSVGRERVWNTAHLEIVKPRASR